MRFMELPNSTKKHLINKANQMQAMGGIPSGYAVYYFNTSYNHQPMAFQVNNVATYHLENHHRIQISQMEIVVIL